METKFLKIAEKKINLYVWKARRLAKHVSKEELTQAAWLIVLEWRQKFPNIEDSLLEQCITVVLKQRLAARTISAYGHFSMQKGHISCKKLIKARSVEQSAIDLEQVAQISPYVKSTVIEGLRKKLWDHCVATFPTLPIPASEVLVNGETPKSVAKKYQIPVKDLYVSVSQAKNIAKSDSTIRLLLEELVNYEEAA